MKFVHLLLQLLLAFAFLLDYALAQSPPGFISLDCGLRGSSGYNDSDTGLFYTTDDAYVVSGRGRSVSPEYKGSVRHFFNVRSFPGLQGSRHCYTFKPFYGKGNKVLLRLAFMYGNYDGENNLPQFDLYLGVDYWGTVKIFFASFVEVKEILHIPTSDYLNLCLVNTGLGTPFISLVELRPFDPLRPMYNTTFGSLELVARWDLGNPSFHSIRYKDDPFDRRWLSRDLLNCTVINTTATTLLNQSPFYPPTAVMRTANQMLQINDSMTFTINPDNFTSEYYVYLHFAEFVANSSREMNIYRNGFLWFGPFVPSYLRVETYGSRSGSYVSDFTINATSNSKLPAMLNAFEVYLVKKFMHSETYENDVSAIYSVRTFYGIKRNWEGDPCLPQSFVWTGINCSYDAFDQPNIIHLDLSSSKLVGTIAPSISNLTTLQSLDLSNNNLTGEVPEFLSWLPSLTHLYLQGNKFTGVLPSQLLEKSKNGSLTLSFDVPSSNTTRIPDNCENDACKKKKSNTSSIIVPIVTSVAGLFGILAFSVILFIFIRTKRKDSLIEPQLRQFTFSEVMNMIRDMRILGEGGFGNVYQGSVNGIQVAVKVLKVSPEEQTTDFRSEVIILATVHHTNLTRILGYCNEGINRAIIFELMENGSLMSHLSESNPNVLSLETRLLILGGAAQGLDYLHHGCDPPIIHRDIKPQNILLTRDFVAKLADFGLSRIYPVQTARIMGTPGHHDPEYNEPSMLTEKVDVYSFGVVMLVVMTGKPAVIQGATHITQWKAPHIPNGDIRGIVDPRLHENYDINVAWRVVELGMACVSRDPSSRPNMHDVVRELTTLQRAASATPQHSDDVLAAGTALITLNMRSVFSPRTT